MSTARAFDRGTDLAGASASLTRAFRDDPAFAWLWGAAQAPADSLAWLFPRWIRVVSPHAECWTVGTGRALGLMLMVPPGQPSATSTWQQLRVGLAKMPFVFGWRVFRRFLMIDADVKRRHARHLTGGEIVLDLLGVDPEVQGQGLGRALMERLIDRAAELRAPIYLITHNPTNVPFYRRFGFEVMEQAPFAPGAPPGFSMRRP